MAFKIVAILALAAIVSAGPLGQYKNVEYQYENEGPAEYDFNYSVHDEHTGDIKSQQESRKGDAVHGSYSLIDSDGFKRTVEYTADDHHGFNAVVHREPTDFKVPTPVAAHVPHYAPVAAPIHYQPAQYTKVVAPVHYQPAQQYHQAPVHYQPAAPVQYTKYVAPVVAKVVAPIHYSAPVAKVSVGYEANHVSFNGAGANYHY